MTFKTGIEQRDTSHGLPRCVICGAQTRPNLQRCHIITQAKQEGWRELMLYGWIPEEAKEDHRHDPRNGILMCRAHHYAFDTYKFFIRFLPNSGRFVFINFSDDPLYQEHHGKAIAINAYEDHSPFPALFLVHEQRVRGFHPFKDISPEISEDVPWQDWMLLDDVVDNGPGPGPIRFKRQSPGGPTSAAVAGGGSSSGGSSVGLMPGPNFDLIAEIRSIIRGTIRVILYVLLSPIRACFARRR